MKTQKEKDEWDLQCYGVLSKDIDKAMDNNLGGTDLLGIGLSVTSILSDAQHVMDSGDTKLANQFINKAKYILGRHMRQNCIMSKT